MQIYKITNLLNNKIYIGKDTTSDPSYFGSGLLIRRAIEKYGKINFIKEVIDETGDYDNLSEKEIYWIEKYNSTDRNIGYNISKGGDGGNVFLNHPNLDMIKEKISKNNPKTGKTYEEAFGEEKSIKYKNKLKVHLHKNILSPEVRHRMVEKWTAYNDNFRKRCEFIKMEIKRGNIEEYKDELKLIKKRCSHNFLENARGFYDFFGEDLRYIFGKLKINEDVELNKINNWIQNKDLNLLVKYMNESIPSRVFKRRHNFYDYIGNEIKELLKLEFSKKRKKSKHAFNDEHKIKIIIDSKEYVSIYEATQKLNIDRSKIRSRLKSSHFKNYLFQDEELNKKYNKFVDIDPHLSKKEPVSINEKVYESITEASKDLNKPSDYITWRLNSKSYPNWFYLNKDVQLKETGPIKVKSVSINGDSYDSIADAVRETGIDRQIMRYRLKSNNYPEYFYI